MTIAKWAFGFGLAALCCGGHTENAGSGGSSPSGGSAGQSGGSAGLSGGAGGSAGTTGGSGGSAGAPGGSGGANGDCAAIADAITKQTQIVGATSVVVRLDYQTHAVLGHAFISGAYSQTNETGARNTAQADTGWGSGELLSGPTPSDDWVFFTAPGDFGGASAVSAHTGLTVFGGSVVWSGKGDIVYPKSWDATDLGSGCGNTPAPTARGFDVGSGQPLEAFPIQSAVDVVWQTAVPAGLAHWGSILDVMVLQYPRTVGLFDPTTAEMIVIVNGGWLE